MTLKRYRTIDIIIFGIIAIVFELVNYLASTSFKDFKLVFMSYTIVLTIIAMYRWGLRGIVVSALGALSSCLIAKATWNQYLAYIFGNVLGVFVGYIIFQYKIGRNKLKEKKILLIAYLLVDFSLVILFRSLIISIGSENGFLNEFITSLKGLIIQESMSILISSVILLIASIKKSQLMVEMIGYIKDVQDDKKLGGLRELKRSEFYNQDKPFTEPSEFDESNILEGGTLSQEDLDELDEMMKRELETGEDGRTEEEKDGTN